MGAGEGEQALTLADRVVVLTDAAAFLRRASASRAAARLAEVAHRGFQGFQDPYTSRDPRQTAERAIDEILRLHHGWDVDRRQARIEQLAELVGLDSRQGRTAR